MLIYTFLNFANNSISVKGTQWQFFLSVDVNNLKDIITKYEYLKKQLKNLQLLSIDKNLVDMNGLGIINEISQISLKYLKMYLNEQ